MKILVLMLMVMFLVGGCATTYDHPTKSPAAFEQDRLECEQIARQSLAARGIDDC